eukprot:777947-Rhodomonas_salina.3
MPCQNRSQHSTIAIYEPQVSHSTTHVSGYTVALHSVWVPGILVAAYAIMMSVPGIAQGTHMQIGRPYQ